MKKIIFIALIILGLFGIQFALVWYPVDRPLLFLSGILFRSTAHTIQPDSTSSEAIQSAREQMLADENRELKQQLQFKQRSDIKMIGASLDGYTTDPARSAFVISRGTDDGVISGTPVTAGDGIFIGSIQSATKTRSTVLSLHDPRSKILIMIPREQKGVHGIAEGRFNVGVELTTIPITEELRVGDIVMTSGLQEGIPAGLVIGTISDIKKRPEELFQTARVSIPYSTIPPRNVSIIIPPDEQH